MAINFGKFGIDCFTAHASMAARIQITKFKQ
jgi:hypothetical protein